MTSRAGGLPTGKRPLGAELRGPRVPG